MKRHLANFCIFGTKSKIGKKGQCVRPNLCVWEYYVYFLTTGDNFSQGFKEIKRGKATNKQSEDIVNTSKKLHDSKTNCC